MKGQLPAGPIGAVAAVILVAMLLYALWPVFMATSESGKQTVCKEWIDKFNGCNQSLMDCTSALGTCNGQLEDCRKSLKTTGGLLDECERNFSDVKGQLEACNKAKQTLADELNKTLATCNSTAASPFPPFNPDLTSVPVILVTTILLAVIAFIDACCKIADSHPAYWVNFILAFATLFFLFLNFMGWF